MSSLDPQTQLNVRKKLIWAFSWAIPNQEAILGIAKYTPIIEIGAGTGYWAWLLEQAGARVKTFDREPGQPPQWHSIEQGDPAGFRLPSAYPLANPSEAFSPLFSEGTLLLCWPPLDSPMATDALNHYTGETVIYVGEWKGRTADSLFHQKLSEEWKLIREITIPNWPGYTDKVYVFIRLVPTESVI